VILLQLSQFGFVPATDLQGVQAAGMKSAPGGRIDGARDVTLQGDPLPPRGWVGDGGGREERLGIWVERSRIEFLPCRDLDDFSEVHHRDPITHMLDHGQVVGDEEIGEAELSLEVLEKIDHLGLDGDIQAETASSQTISLGLSASALATPRRWR